MSLARPSPASPGPRPVPALLDRYRPLGTREAADLRRIRALADHAADPWERSSSLHLTASALVIHPPTGRVLLRWHSRQGEWLQVGGHADPGERDPLAIALREAEEETGLADLAPWPDGQLRHVSVVAAAAGRGEPAHEHADLRFFLATGEPGAARAESARAPLHWMPAAEAHDRTPNASLRETLARARRLIGT